MEPVEKTVVDRYVRLAYREYLADCQLNYGLDPAKIPILRDLYGLLRKNTSRNHRLGFG
ncbi:MAG: hypothetical protein LBU32_20935 [Clostridiales bacterium]|nr:hypothetical protein [Clostridiales bacterium]